MEIVEFDEIKIDELPAYRYESKYTVGDKEISYTRIMVGADEIYYFSYEQKGTRQFDKVIEESINSIGFEYEGMRNIRK